MSDDNTQKKFHDLYERVSRLEAVVMELKRDQQELWDRTPSAYPRSENCPSCGRLLKNKHSCSQCSWRRNPPKERLY